MTAKVLVAEVFVLWGWLLLSRWEPRLRSLRQDALVEEVTLALAGVTLVTAATLL